MATAENFKRDSLHKPCCIYPMDPLNLQFLLFILLLNNLESLFFKIKKLTNK